MRAVSEGFEKPARLPLVLVLVLGWLVVADIPTAVSLGPISVSGAATLLAGVATLALAPMLVLHGRGRSAPRTWDYLVPPGPRRRVVPLGLVLFCGVALLGAIRVPSSSGVQETCVYLGFVGTIAAAALYSREDTAQRLLEAMGVLMCLVGIAAVPSYLMGLPLWGARSYALAATVAVAALAPLKSDRLLVRLAPYTLTVGIAASLSRTALAVAVLLLAFSILRSRHGMRGARVVVSLVVLAAVGTALFLTIPALRDRFVQGDNSLTIDGIALNTSGRSQIWAVVIQDALPHPWIGRGAGTASDLIGARYAAIAQPHNDYLRLWHDFGVIGLTLFVVGYAALVIGAIRRARRTEQEHRGVHWGAALALLAVAASAITDNPIIYPFVMLPLGAVVGLSIARRDLHRLDAPPRAAVRRRRPVPARS